MAYDSVWKYPSFFSFNVSFQKKNCKFHNTSRKDIIKHHHRIKRKVIVKRKSEKKDSMIFLSSQSSLFVVKDQHKNLPLSQNDALLLSLNFSYIISVRHVARSVYNKSSRMLVKLIVSSTRVVHIASTSYIQNTPVCCILARTKAIFSIMRFDRRVIKPGYFI